MRNLVASFSEQLKEALEIGTSAQLKSVNKTFQNVLIIGLGGSGIGGTVVSEVLENECLLPIKTCKGYDVPAWVTDKTLVIVSSYSGNTEESLMAMREATKRGAEIAAITSGGQLKAFAEENNLNHIVVPGGNPPRSMFAYSFCQQLVLLKHYGLHSIDISMEIETTIALLTSQEENIKLEAESVASALNGKVPVLYSTEGYEGVTVRLRQQLNENSKVLCWHHVIPEMNHNELVGWKHDNKDIQVVLLRNVDDHPRNQTRIEINKTVLEPKSNPVIEIWSKGDSKLQRTLYHVHLGDWISIFLGEQLGADLVEIEVINFLKGELGKQ